MTDEEIKVKQIGDRQAHLNKILNSKASKRLIVAGPGTGKTYTFKKVIDVTGTNNILVLTFIRKLVAEMATKFVGIKDVYTFHKFCKKVLHKIIGKVDIYVNLTSIIQEDGELLKAGGDLSSVELSFQNLDESNRNIIFYLERGDYYEAIAFNDSVYRLYKLLSSKPDVLKNYDQIIIDEFQDFNPLEVAFLEELEKYGPILIAGDDDQAVYDQRCSSPQYLRDKHSSGKYDTFNLPFCSRCTDVIVKAANSVIEQATIFGYYPARIPKPYECFLPDKQVDSLKYPLIELVQVPLLKTVAKYIHSEIKQIPAQDIEESYVEGSEYPTALIIGPTHFLRTIYDYLKPLYKNVAFADNEQLQVSVKEAYQFLFMDPESNIGWRILVYIFLNRDEKRKIIEQTPAKKICELISTPFRDSHLRIVGILHKFREEDVLSDENKAFIEATLGAVICKELLNFYAKPEETPSEDAETDQPSILLTTFVGAKGLSGGHVFIVGMNESDMPKSPLTDVEISKFLVALTRTRKRCHLVANKWLHAPKTNGNWNPISSPSSFIGWIPKKLINDRGSLKSSDITL